MAKTERIKDEKTDEVAAWDGIHTGSGGETVDYKKVTYVHSQGR
jgi:hypothetical protein